MNDDEQDIRPRPDPTALTTAQLDREIAHLKELMNRDCNAMRELMDKDRTASSKAIEVALLEMNRRLAELNELRKEVEADRAQFVRSDIYFPAHDELRRQRNTDREVMLALTAEVKQNATDLAELKSSMTWLSRLVIGAVILGLIGYIFNRLVH